MITSNARGGVIHYIEAISDFWWTNYITGVKFGSGQNLDSAYRMSSYKAFTDTSSSCTYIPPVYYSWITDVLMMKASNPTKSATWGYTLPCSDRSRLDSIKFFYGDLWLEMHPKDYLVDIDGEICGLCMLESSVISGGDTYWVLGTNFMRGFYVVYDHE